MIEEMLRKFTDLPEEEWKASKLRRLLNKAIDNHNGKPEVSISVVTTELADSHSASGRNRCYMSLSSMS